MTASVSYFRSLPVAYRPLVLDQLRSMGGTRFVVTLNDRPLDMQVLPETPRKQAVLVAVDEVLRQTLTISGPASPAGVAPAWKKKRKATTGKARPKRAVKAKGA